MYLLSLIITSFLQSTFLPLNLVVVLIMVRSYLSPDRKTIYFAFLSGIFLAILTSANLGFYPIVFLLVVKLFQIIKNTPSLSHTFFFFLFAASCLTIMNFLEQFILKTNFFLPKLLWEIVLTFPLYYLIRFWEERVNAKNLKGFRLRL